MATRAISPLAAAARVAGTVLLTAALAACSAQQSDRGNFTPPPTPPALATGQGYFRQHCVRCHGSNAAGTDSGPPLVHAYYRPAHHADQAFLLAVRQGVRAHHWRFGNMPPQPQVPDSQIAPIISYVRWLQQAAGIR